MKKGNEGIRELTCGIVDGDGKENAMTIGCGSVRKCDNMIWIERDYMTTLDYFECDYLKILISQLNNV